MYQEIENNFEIITQHKKKTEASQHNTVIQSNTKEIRYCKAYQMENKKHKTEKRINKKSYFLE